MSYKIKITYFNCDKEYYTKEKIEELIKKDGEILHNNQGRFEKLIYDKGKKIVIQRPVRRDKNILVKIKTIFRKSKVINSLERMEKRSINIPIAAVEYRKFGMINSSYAIYEEKIDEKIEDSISEKIVVLVDREESKVIYNRVNNTYIKKFELKKIDKLKCLLGIRKYPGNQFNDISVFLNEKLKIKTPEILFYNKYKVITKGMEGNSLLEELLIADENRVKFLLDIYSSVVAKVLKSGIYFHDFHFKNFIVLNDEIYALDLDDYTKSIFSFLKKNKVLKMLKKHKIEDFVERLNNEAKKRNNDDINKIVNFETLYGLIKSKFDSLTVKKSL